MQKQDASLPRSGTFSLKIFVIGLFVFITAPMLLLMQSKYKGTHDYSPKSRQVLRHYLQMTIDVYCDRAQRGSEYPEYSGLLIREFLNSGNHVSAETWLRYGVFEWRNPALAELYAKLTVRGVLSVKHPRSFSRLLKEKAKEFRNAPRTN